MKFLRYDSPFMTGFRRIVDYMLLGLLWFIASIPIITFGAATTAMFMTAEISIHKDEDKLFVPFWKHFRAEFKQATILWLIQLPILAVLIFYAMLVWESQIHYFLKLISYVIIGLIFIWTQLWFGYQSKFVDNLKTVLVNTLRITLGNLGRSILLALISALTFLASCVALVYFSPVLLLIPGAYVICYTSVLRKLFQRVIPKEEPIQEEAALEEPASEESAE